MLKVLIAADMEGISGVVSWAHVSKGKPDYERFRRIMTGDVNAAVRGSFQTGADDVVVVDGHDDGQNIIYEDLEPRTRLIAGSPPPFTMVQGIDSGVSVAMLVGYHARYGTYNAVMDHTWCGAVINLWLNGKQMGEIGLAAAVCGHFDVPVVMISGDQAAAAEASDLIPGIEAAVVKKGMGRNGAECLPVEVAQQKIREGAARAISRVRADMAPAPLRIEAPVMVTMELLSSGMADRVAMLNGTDRLDPRRISYTADDILAAYRFFQVAADLANMK